MRVDTPPGRPSLHVTRNGSRISVSQMSCDGALVRFRVTRAEALKLADALVDTAEGECTDADGP